MSKVSRGEVAELAFRAREERCRRKERSLFQKRASLFDSLQIDRIFSSEFIGKYCGAESEIDLVSALRELPAEGFFPGFESALSFEDSISSDDKRGILQSADSILENAFPIFNLGRISFGQPTRWHFDPSSGKSAPADKFYHEIDYLNSAEVGDVKVIWELSRMQFVYDLGQAYVITKDERYPKKFFELLHSWIQENRPFGGVNYCSALEFAFRANSIVWGAFFFRSSQDFDASTAHTIMRLLHLCGTFLQNHLSHYFAPNTHLLGEAYGLYLLGTVLDSFADAPQWRDIGRRVLTSELDRQFTNDGMHAELSTAYHAYALEFVLSALILGERNQDRFPELCYQKLGKMVDVLEALRWSDGTWPHIGDEDGGRLYFLGRRPSHDYSGILDASNRFLNRESKGGMQAESRWLVGRTNDGTDQKPTYGITNLNSTGLLCARNKRTEFTLQYGKFGYLDSPHSHADHLHIDIRVDGEHLLIDPGTHNYTADVATRNLYRGFSSHNGPAVDGTELLSNKDPFAWRQKPDCPQIAFYSGRFSSFHRAAYSIRDNKRRSIRLERSVLYLHDYGWLVRDEIATKAPVEGRWNFVSPFKFSRDSNGIRIGAKTHQHQLYFWADRQTNIEISDFLISDDYLSTSPGSKLTITSEPANQIFTCWGIFLGEDDTTYGCRRYIASDVSAGSAAEFQTGGKLGLIRASGDHIVSGCVVECERFRFREREYTTEKSDSGIFEIEHGEIVET